MDDFSRPEFGIIEDKQASSKNRKPTVKKTAKYGNEDMINDIASSSMAAGNVIAEKSIENYVFAGTGQSPHTNFNMMSSTNSDDDQSKKPLKLRQKRVRDGPGSENVYISDMIPYGKDESIMKRRKKSDLKITVDPSKQRADISQELLTADTPRQSSYRTRSTAHSNNVITQPPLSLISNFSAGAIESPLNDKSTIFGGDIFSAFVDTPSGMDSNRIGMKPMPSIGNYDFDEVTKHFPSPRTGDGFATSPNRWGAAQNAGSFGLGVGIFNFPPSGSSNAMNQNKPNGNMTVNTSGFSHSSMPEAPSSDYGAADIHAKKFKRQTRREPISIATNASDLSISADALVSMRSPTSSQTVFNLNATSSV